MHRHTTRNAPRLARTLACAAVALPVLLVAGCSSDSDSSGEDSASPSASQASKKPTVAPAKHKELPDACKTLPKDTVKDLVPGTENETGKRIGSGDTNDSGSCLWSGLEKYDYRQVTVSLKRFDSDQARGSGDKLAGEFAKQQVADVQGDKDNKDVKAEQVKDIGDEATAVAYKVKKKDDKDKSEDFREQRLVARDANVVIVVDYEGAGFEDAKTPGADDLRKKAEKAAKDAVASLSKKPEEKSEKKSDDKSEEKSDGKSEEKPKDK